MRNSIFAFVLLLCGFGIQAQSKKAVAKVAQNTAVAAPIQKLSVEDAAQKNVTDLAAFTPLTKDNKDLLLGLFITKGKMHENHKQYEMDHAQVSQIIALKMESVLEPAIMTKLRANKVLFNSLVN